MSVDQHIAELVALFREVRRVLRDDGTFWLNYGDAYAGHPNGRSAADTKAAGNDDRTFRDKPISTVGGVFKPKDRMLLPARLAIALQEDGWWIRDEIIWHKPNPMPSSVKDRTTPAHEMIYMLSKRPRYYYDQEAILEPATQSSKARLAQDIDAQEGSARANGGVRADRPMKAVSRRNSFAREHKASEGDHGQKPQHRPDREIVDYSGIKRNPRSVWTVTPKGFKEAHFATFPPDLIKPCILAGCPEGGTVLDPFFGAGTTGLVAQQNGRNCIGIELNADYIDIAKRRLGLTPKHEGVFA
jgi:DNA modification methylase